MNFRDFGKYNQFKEQFTGMSPEMKEQMMKMAKEQMKARLNAFVQKWFSQPILIVVALFLGALVGALTAFFGQVLLAVSALRDAHPLYWIPGLALIGIAIVRSWIQEVRQRYGTRHGHGLRSRSREGKRNSPAHDSDGRRKHMAHPLVRR